MGQQLLMDRQRDAVLDVPAPILSRVFQELSRGIVQINKARQIHQVPFPFACLVAQALMFQFTLTSVVLPLLFEYPWWASIFSFTVTFFYWTLNHVALEMEDPFGDDESDLPLSMVQLTFNNSVAALLQPSSLSPPNFDFSEQQLVEYARISSSGRRCSGIPLPDEETLTSRRCIEFPQLKICQTSTHEAGDSLGSLQYFSRS